jgi:hypothetical protein
MSRPGSRPGRINTKGQHPAAGQMDQSSLSFASCVEVATLPDGMIGIRNSKDSEGPVLRFTPGEWNAFLAGALRGEFDQAGRTPSGITSDSGHEAPKWPRA